MTKILSARDLLELAKQEGETRAKDPLVTIISANRLVYSGKDDRRRPAIRRPVDERLPMVQARGPQPPQPPVAPRMPAAPAAPLPPKMPMAPVAPQPPKMPAAPKAPEPPRAPAPPRVPAIPELPKAPQPPAAAAPRPPAPPVAPAPPPVPRAPSSSPNGKPAAVPLSAPEPLPPKRPGTRPVIPREEEPDERAPISEPPTAQRNIPKPLGGGATLAASGGATLTSKPQAARLDPNFERDIESDSVATTAEAPFAAETRSPEPSLRARSLEAQPTLLELEMPSFDDLAPMSEEPVALSGDETLVLLNYDKTMSVEAVAQRTGLTPYLVGVIINDLQGRGMLEEQDPLTGARRRSSRPPKPRVYDLLEEPPQPPQPPMAPAKPRALLLDDLGDDADLAVPVAPTRGNIDHATIEMAAPTKEMLAAAQQDPAPASAAPASSRKPDADEEIVGDDVASGPDEEEGGDALAASANYQRHYETVLAALAPDMRARIASAGTGTDLFALAFDKDPAVARALWENPTIAMEHARFASFHHRTAFGLERMTERGDFARDAQVQRRLIRNPMLSETLLRRLLLPKRLIDIYKVALDRDVPEKSRASAKGILRTKFQTAEAEDRVQLIWNTEGRCLMNLTGLNIDSKSTSIICGRPITSIMLVQNFCRFGATPPAIIHHCLKQPMIRRQAHLRNLLLKHPNCPSEAKRAY